MAVFGDGLYGKCWLYAKAGGVVVSDPGHFQPFA
jgi:hypothetical protein